MIKLAKKGRIKLNSQGDVVGQPTNPVTHIEKREIKNEGGFVMGTIEVPVNGGHARMEGSVWRTALKGPKKYHVMVLADNIMRLRKHDKYARGSAPELTEEEADDYLKYEAFLLEKGVEIAEDADFYDKKQVGRPKKEVDPV